MWTLHPQLPSSWTTDKMAAGMVPSASRPEHMNATTHHSKVRVTISLSSSLFVAGEEVTGKMEMECRADAGVGIGVIMAELFAVQELNSRDHSATSTFMHIRRLFQGPGLPPSNAVVAHPAPGQQPLPQGHLPARRGITTFFFRFPVPLSSPSAVSFASGLARVRYEVRASVSVAHRGEKRLVTDVVDADIVQCADMDGAVPEHVVVGENGKMYVQGRVLGGRLVSGQQACVELHVKNHSQKKTTGLSLTLTRALYLNDVASPPPIQLTDTLVSENFRGDEYTVQPGVEGVASLVFNVPSAARVVKGGLREGATDGALTAPLFELRCILAIRIGMGIASKDVLFEIPVQLSHPATLPAQQDAPISQREMSPHPYFLQSPGSGSEGSSPAPLHDPSPRAYASRPLPISPQPPHPYPSPPLSYAATPAPYYLPPIPYAQPHHWSPPPHNMPYFMSAPDTHHQYYFPPPPVPLVPFAHPARPSSAGAPPPDSNGLPGVGVTDLSGLPGVGAVTHAYPSFQSQYHNHVPPEEPVYQHPFPQSQPIPEEQYAVTAADSEEGKGARASRITQHLRTSTRARSASPTAHRFPGTAPAPSETIQTMHNVPHRTPAALYATTPRDTAAPPVLSPRPVRSPRHSFSGTAGVEGTARSLERMVDSQPGNEERSVAEVLRDLEQDTEKDKTLPPPPVPSGKASRESVPGVRDVFALNRNSEEAVAHPKKSVLRPSPMARRITAEENMIRGAESGARLLKPAASGLDALEQRLLHEVGTRKPEKLERPTILPLRPVPSSSTAPHPPTRLVQRDSEISDLALASHGSAGADARTTSNSAQFTEPSSPHKGSQEKLPVGVDTARPRSRTTSAARDKDKETPRNREEKTRQQEAMKLRKEAKGRVADWLGGVAGPSNDDVVGDVVPSPESKSGGSAKRNNATIPGVNKSADTRTVSPLTNMLSLSRDEGPNAGRQQTSRPTLPLAPPISTHRIDDEKFLDRKQLSPKLATSPSGSPRLSSSPSPLPFKPPALPKPPALVSPRLQPGSSKDNSQPADTSSNPAKVLPRVPGLLSSPAMPDQKYDVRSARGGKGGITTSVAAMWASMANEGNSNKPIKPLPKPIAVAPFKRPTSLDVGKAKPSPTPTEAKTTDALEPLVSSNGTAPPSEQTPQRRNLVKSASVPAAVVSTHARPHLSSSASLARPAAVGVTKPKPPSLSPTLSATPEEPVSKAMPVAQGELAFGQARLKDLIKKYQQAAS